MIVNKFFWLMIENTSVDFGIVIKLWQIDVISFGKEITFIGSLIAWIVDSVGTSTIRKTAKRVFN